MERKLQEQLKDVFDAPGPYRKREFLRTLPQPKPHIGNMLLTQLLYISKSVWCISAVLFGGIVLAGYKLKADSLWTMGALMPFFVMLAVSELMRSLAYGMDELEMSARFSLKSIIIVRMIIFGTVDFVLILLSAFLMPYMFWRNMLYLFVPYLFTAFISLSVVRRIHGKESTCACAGIAVIVSLLDGICTMSYKWIYDAQYAGFWMLASGIFLYLTIRESYRTIRMTEELTWN